MSRLTPIVRDAATTEQGEAFDTIAESRGGADRLTGADGGLIGPFNAMVTSPGMGLAMGNLGGKVRFENSLDARLKELAIVTAGAHWKADFEFWAHAPLAISAGVSEAAIESIRSGAEPSFGRPDEEVVWRFASQLVATGRVGDAAYAAAIEVLGEQSVVDLVITVGYYSLISLTLNAFEVPLPPGEDPVW